MTKMKQLLTSTMKALILLFGLVMIYWGADDLLSIHSDWPSVEGQVISVVEQYSYSDGTTMEYKITYEYQVGADKFTGTYTHFEARPVGEKTTVYYDPASPGDSVHSPGRSKWMAFWGLVFGLGCVAWVVWQVIKAIRGRRSESVEPGQAS